MLICCWFRFFWLSLHPIWHIFIYFMSLINNVGRIEYGHCIILFFIIDLCMRMYLWQFDTYLTYFYTLIFWKWLYYFLRCWCPWISFWNQSILWCPYTSIKPWHIICLEPFFNMSLYFLEFAIRNDLKNGNGARCTNHNNLTVFSDLYITNLLVYFFDMNNDGWKISNEQFGLCRYCNNNPRIAFNHFNFLFLLF